MNLHYYYLYETILFEDIVLTCLVDFFRNGNQVQKSHWNKKALLYYESEN